MVARWADQREVHLGQTVKIRRQKQAFSWDIDGYAHVCARVRQSCRNTAEGIIRSDKCDHY